MGNVESSSGYQKHLSRFLPDEQADINGVFVALSGAGEIVGGKVGKAFKTGVTLAALKAYVKEALPESMVVRLYNGMKSIQPTEKSPGSNGQVVKEQFVVFMSALFKGNAEEKRGIVMKMISSREGTVKGSQILEFAEDLVGSAVHVLSYRKKLKGWNLKNMQNSTAGIKALASQLISELKSADGKRRERDQALDAVCDESSIEDWVFRVPQVSAFLTVIVQQGLLVLHSLPDQDQDALRLLPECQGVKGSRFVSFLDIPSVTYINSHLPSELQHKWRLIFASRVHGESFTQLCGHIVNKGPCVLVLKDADGYVFGGFSSCSWAVKPQFQGDNGCFLFSVSPSLAVFTHTGYNDHYMYLNHGQHTMPNGLGMGGQHEYFGLWVDSNYGKGHSKAKPRCTTYNSPQLSAQENFTLDAIEVWAVGEPPESATGKGPKSILDVDPEAQALLEMVGKSRQSDGLRDPADDRDGN
ncbi:MTOR-associated protein MEAK7 [Rhineura floridana]|uniref:MTOR-associated protein MEAK7 n=1 Tax=Rhineura floridana TaxID=261503 RepID=UPI002AC851E5|nr:MTOR-associated protein MEAK7 [Rhineura floridana]XP_061449726.1 MTOR-associated protein MEAK7 [Rhineura floridana]